MGINVWGFYCDGETKVTQGPATGYCASSKDLLTTILSATQRVVSSSVMARIISGVRKQTMIAGNALVSNVAKDAVKKHYTKQGRKPIDLRGAARWGPYQEVLMPLNGDAIYDALMGDPMPIAINDEYALCNSIQCDAAYIINLDEERLEIHSGKNEDHAAPGRYVKDPINVNNRYAGVKHVASVGLRDILTASIAIPDISDQIEEFRRGRGRPTWDKIICVDDSRMTDWRAALAGISQLAVL